MAPPAAEQVILQLDLAQTIALCGTAFAGVTGAAIGVAKVFTKYLEGKDKLQDDRVKVRDDQTRELAVSVREMATSVHEQAEKAKETQETIAASARDENRKTVDNLIGLNREVIQAMGAVNQRVGESTAVVANLQANIGQGVTELKGEVRNLSDTVGDLGAVMTQLGHSVEDLKERLVGGGPRPPAPAPDRPKREGGK